MPPGIGYGPGLINPAILMSAAQQPGALSPARPGGVGGFFQRPGLQQALLSMGAALLAQKDQGGSFGGAVGRALPAGVQGFRRGQQEAALNDVFADAPESMRRLMRGLPLAMRQMLAVQMATKEPAGPDIREGREGEFLQFGPDGTVTTLTTPPPETPTPTAFEREYEIYLQAHEGSGMTEPELLAGFYAMRRAPGTTVNVGPAETAAQRAVGEQVAGLVGTEAARVRQSLPVLTSVDRAIEITERPEFRSVTGPTRPVGEFLAKISTDPTARQLQAEFDLITGAITLDKLEAFTGPKSNYELEMAKRLASGDRSMPADGLKAGLEYIRRVMQADAVNWAERMLALDPSLYGLDPRMIEDQRARAQDILRRLGQTRNATSADFENMTDAEILELIMSGGR